MNIVVLGAGAIGSFFGGILSKKNNVTLIGRKQHIQEINNHGLQISGKTSVNRKISAVEHVHQINQTPDVIILSVKSFDTLKAITQAKEIISKKTMILSFQNGLNNIDQIKKVVPQEQIIAGITTHGVQFVKPGMIHHKGKGSTVIGELSGEKTKRILQIASMLNDVGIPVRVSNHIKEDIWKKAIVNASINPITAIFNCENGYLSKNPILITMIHKITEESTEIAKKNGFLFDTEEMIEQTMHVIEQTQHNISSMLQSIRQGKPTEINEINGAIVEKGRSQGCIVELNALLTKMIKKMQNPT
jgi:2-dehydropantoate 2-reductase